MLCIMTLSMAAVKPFERAGAIEIGYRCKSAKVRK